MHYCLSHSAHDRGGHKLSHRSICAYWAFTVNTEAYVHWVAVRHNDTVHATATRCMPVALCPSLFSKLLGGLEAAPMDDSQATVALCFVPLYQHNA